MAWLSEVRQGVARHGVLGVTGRGVAWTARQGGKEWRGKARCVEARHGVACEARFGEAWLGKAERGTVSHFVC